MTSPEVVKRFDEEILALRKEIKHLTDKQGALHGTVYKVIETIGELRREKK